MKEVKTNFWTKAKRFIKKNAYVLSVAGCAILLVVALVVTATVRGKNADFDINDANNYYEEESIDSINNPISFSHDLFIILL